MEKKMYVCRKCGSTLVETKMWQDLNTKQIIDSAGDGDLEDNFCNRCQSDCYVDELEARYKVGKVLVIVGDTSGHGFKIGSEVVIDETWVSDNVKQYKVIDGEEMRYVTEDELEVYEPKKLIRISAEDIRSIGEAVHYMGRLNPKSDETVGYDSSEIWMNLRAVYENIVPDGFYVENHSIEEYKLNKS